MSRYKVFLGDEKELAKLVRHLLNLQTAQPSHFVALNPHSEALSYSDAILKEAILKAKAILCDGIGVYYSCRCRGSTVKRIAGRELFRIILEECNKAGRTVGFLGADTATLNAMVQKLKCDFPTLTTAMALDPGEIASDRPTLNDEILHAIQSSQPSVLFLGLGSPKQEKLCIELARLNYNCLVVPIGAVFKQYAGVSAQVPNFVSKLGLEFVYRLLLEPKRLWRRTFISLPIFISKELLFHIRKKA